MYLNHVLIIFTLTVLINLFIGIYVFYISLHIPFIKIYQKFILNLSELNSF